MDHAYKLNASATPPAFPASFSVGYPQPASVDGSTPPTYPGAWMWYALVEEMRNVILAAGMTPSAAAVNQVSLAVQSMITAAVGGGGGGAGLNVITPTSFGCVGDGVTDDTAGMYACFAAASGKIVDGGGKTYKLNMSDAAHTTIVDTTAAGSSFTATIAPLTTTTSTMTVTGSPTGTLAVGQRLTGTGIPANTSIIALGTGAGGAGTYILNGSITVGTATTVTGTVGYGANKRWFLAHNALTVRNMVLIGNVSFQGHNAQETNGLTWCSFENVDVQGDARWAIVWSIVSRCNVTGTSWPGSDYPPSQNGIGFFYNLFQSSQLGLWRVDFRYGWQNDNAFIQCRARNIKCVNTFTSDVSGATGWSVGEALGFHKNNWISCEVFCAAASFTASLAPRDATTSLLTVTALTAGSPSLLIEQELAGTGVPVGTRIVSQLSGTLGGVGTYAVSVPALTVASETMTGTDAISYSGAYGSGSFCVVMEDLFYNGGSNTLGTNWLDIYDEGVTVTTGGASAVYGNAWLLKDLQISGAPGLVNAGNMGWNLPISGMLADNAAFRALPTVMPAGPSFVGGDWSILNTHGYPYCIDSPSITGVPGADATEPTGLGKSVTFAMGAGQAIWLRVGGQSTTSRQLISFAVLMNQTAGGAAQWQTQDANGNPVYGAVAATSLGGGWYLYYGATNGNQIQIDGPVSGAWTVKFGAMSAGRGSMVLGPAPMQQGGKPLIDLSNGASGSLVADQVASLAGALNIPPFKVNTKSVTSGSGNFTLFSVQLAAYQATAAEVRVVVTLFSASGGARAYNRQSFIYETGGAAIVETNVTGTVSTGAGSIGATISGTTLTIVVASTLSPIGTVETAHASILVNGQQVTLTAL